MVSTGTRDQVAIIGMGCIRSPNFGTSSSLLVVPRSTVPPFHLYARRGRLEADIVAVESEHRLRRLNEEGHQHPGSTPSPTA
jgi:hypothetical protein